MRQRVRWLPLCAAALLGCAAEAGDGGALGPEAAGPEPGGPGTGFASSPIVASATAGIEFTVPPEVFGVEVGNVLTVNARRLADGGVSGHYEYHQRVEGESFDFGGPITCLAVYDGGTRAKVGGLIARSNDPVFVPGFFIWWQLLDDGEGPGVDRSTISGFGDETENEEFCASPALPRFGPHEVQNGNIRVWAAD